MTVQKKKEDKPLHHIKCVRLKMVQGTQTSMDAQREAFSIKI